MITLLKKASLFILALYTLLLTLARVPALHALPFFTDWAFLAGMVALPCLLFLLCCLVLPKVDGTDTDNISLNNMNAQKQDEIAKKDAFKK